MPTTHVEPGCDPLLQDIANSLWKARKVVVITGAGISTNSGIPDFRSENGLYSLIQAQFDAAQNQGAGSNSDADTSDVSLEERPAKRRRVSRPDPELASQQPANVEERPHGERDVDVQHVETLEEQGDRLGGQIRIASDAHLPYKTGAANYTSEPGQVMVMADIEPADFIPASASTLLPNLRPLPTNRTGMEPLASFASSPPRMALGTPRSRPRPDLGIPRSWSSSPLSSPPPVMFDPYQESLEGSSSGSSSQDSGSSRSESEEPSSASTPLLTSQTSFGSSSSRTSLPNMKGRDLFDAQIWSCPIKTSVFYTFASTLRQKVRTAEPTSSHHFVSVLRDSMKLVRCYTQNIDQLEERVGLTTSLSLGAGNRYRFSVRAGRNAGGARSSMKGPEGTADGSQGSSQRDEEQAGSQSQEKVQPSQASQTDGADDFPSATQSSEAGSAPNSASNDISASTSSAPTPAPPKRGVECVFLHGSLAELRCFVCARTSSWDEEARLADTMAGRQPICPHCAGATAAREERGKRALGVGKLRPDIVLYGEEHPHAHLISPLVQHDLSLGPDMLLILGTSMRVHGLRVLVKEFAKAVHDRGGKVVFVNFTKPPESVWAEIIDYWVQWDCDTWVGDLQIRKPALWLPPGTTPREEEKPKPAKAPRRQSTGDALKRKEGANKTSKKVNEIDGSIVVQEPEVSGLSIEAAPSQSEEMPPPLLPPPPKALPKRPVRVAREPKLNPDAKRPASVRDHKQNGAYCVWKILDDLQRITGGNPSTDARSPGVTATRSKAKKPRKSAPAILESHDHEAIVVQDTPARAPRDKSAGKVKTPGPASSPAPRPLPYKADEPTIAGRDNSISAAVKSRKRKQAPNSPPPPPYRTPKPSSDPPQSTSPGTQNHMITTPNRFKTITPIDTHMDIDAGFRETDRLIAKAAQEVQLASRPSTPPPLLHLPPLNLESVVYDPPMLAALEPKVESPGPRAEISSNVGSPVEARQVGEGNPFFLRDPGLEWLRYPPTWLEQEREEQGYGHGGRWAGMGEGKGYGYGYQGQRQGDRRRDGGGGSGSPWCPDEQLRKEQEAALMLSALRGL